MKEKVEFSVLSYHPSLVTDENINVAIAFSVAPSNKREFYITNNWKRLESFDDELDISFMKKDLRGIKADFENSLFNDCSEFDMRDFVRFYVNELRFSHIEEVEVDNTLDFIECTKKVYMRFDYDHDKRLGKDKEIKYYKRLLREKQIKYQTKPIQGAFEERVQFDFTLGNHGFKFFTFENKNLNRMIDSAKSWAYTAKSLEDRFSVFFVFDIEEQDSDAFCAIRNILGRDATIVTREKVIPLVAQLSMQKE